MSATRDKLPSLGGLTDGMQMTSGLAVAGEGKLDTELMKPMADSAAIMNSPEAKAALAEHDKNLKAALANLGRFIGTLFNKKPKDPPVVKLPEKEKATKESNAWQQALEESK